MTALSREEKKRTQWRESRRQYWATHREELNAKKRAQYKENSELVLAKQAKWRSENPERTAAKYKSAYATEKGYVTNLVAGAKIRARNRGLPFDLCADDLLPIPKFCPVLGIELVRGKGKHHYGSPSIDRERPELGYVRGNVRFISIRANMLKSDATVDEAKDVLKYLEAIAKKAGE